MNCLGSYTVGYESGVPHSLAAILVERRVDYETKKLDSLACLRKICERSHSSPIMLSSPVRGEVREREDVFALNLVEWFPWHLGGEGLQPSHCRLGCSRFAELRGVKRSPRLGPPQPNIVVHRPVHEFSLSRQSSQKQAIVLISG